MQQLRQLLRLLRAWSRKGLAAGDIAHAVSALHTLTGYTSWYGLHGSEVAAAVASLARLTAGQQECCLAVCCLALHTVLEMAWRHPSCLPPPALAEMMA